MKRVACFKNKKLSGKSILSDDEYNALKNHIKPLNNLVHELNFIYDLKSCFKDLNSFLSKYISGEISSQILQKDLNKQVINYLSLIRTFLDKWEKHIKENFGKESKELEIFKNLTHDEYDKNFYYRFLSNLSNYARHTGYAFHQISESLNEDDKKNLETFINKKIFLGGFSWKKSFSDEINSLPEDKINIYPFLNGMFKSMEKIHFKLVEYNIIKDINNLLINSLFLVNFLNKYKDCDGEILITEFIGDEEEIKKGKDFGIDIEHLPLKIALLVIKTYLNAHKKYIKTFNFKGQYLGKIINSFPIKKNNGFFEGSKMVTDQNVKWITLLSELKITPNNIEFLAIYVIAGFPSTYYELNLKVIQTLKESRFNNLLDLFKE